MKTKAVRLYGEMDLRLDEFELPEMQDDEIMAEVVTDSLCIIIFPKNREKSIRKMNL